MTYTAQDPEIDEEILGKMREWIDDCSWDDLELIGDASDLTDQEVLDGVEQHCQGGVDGFLALLIAGNGELP